MPGSLSVTYIKYIIGQVIGSGEMYAETAIIENEIASVKKNCF